MSIRSYRSNGEDEWLKCHVNAYLGSNERRFLKEENRYTRPTVEPVVVDDQRIVAFLDIELEDTPGSICQKKVEGNAMLWDLGILEKHRRKGLGTRLSEATCQLRKHGVKRLEAWSIEDGAKKFYIKFGFQKFYEYYQVLIRNREKLKPLNTDDLHVVEVYAHVMPETNLDNIKEKYAPEETHVCTGFEIQN